MFSYDFFKKHPAVTAFLLTSIFFSLGTIGTEISKIDVRFALMLQDMARHPFGIFPTINAVEYPDYVSLYFFASYLTTLGGRAVNCWTMSLPSILLGGFCVAMTLAIGEKIGKYIGVWAAILLGVSFEYIYLFASFGIDVPVAAAGAAMLWFLHSDKGYRRCLPAFVLLLFFSIMVRGSLGVLVFGGAVAGYLLASANWKRFAVFGIAGGLTTACALAISLWAINKQGGSELMQSVMHWQMGKRIEGGDYFYYILDGTFSLLPVSGAALLTAILCRRTCWRDRSFRAWAGFYLFPIVLLSLPGGKHMRYLTALVPALALMGAWGIVHCPVSRLRLYADRLLALLSRYLPFLGLAAVPVMAALFPMFVQPHRLPWFNWGAAWVVFLLLFMLERKKPVRTELHHALRIAVFIGAVYFGIAVPLVGTMENSSDFVRAVESGRRGRLCFFELGPDHEDLKYVLHMTPERRGEVLYMVRNVSSDTLYRRMYPGYPTAETLPELGASDVIVLKQRDRQKLESALLAAGRAIATEQQGQLGHRDYFAVTLKAVKP